MNAASLYVHVPFCEKKCHYCDFYSVGADSAGAEAMTQFSEALEQEAWLQAPLLAARLETVFFGGGTPSLFEPALMERALRPLWRRSSPSPATEWTMEANPSSITASRLADYRTLGVNRLSIGIQSLQPSLLKLLGRVHTREQALESLENAFQAGFDNVSADLLCGVPGQSLEDLDRSLEELLRFPIVHLSCYLLTLSPGNALFDELPDEETQLEHLLHLDRRMNEQGFEHYEISNFARPGWRARHNLSYWNGSAYLGLGPSAHSFDPSSREEAPLGRRWKNFSSLQEYSRRLRGNELPIEWTETLTRSQREIEHWMLALRLSDGFARDWLDTPVRQRLARELESQGLLEPHPSLPGRLRLTPRGMALSDQIVEKFV